MYIRCREPVSRHDLLEPFHWQGSSEVVPEVRPSVGQNRGQPRTGVAARHSLQAPPVMQRASMSSSVASTDPADPTERTESDELAICDEDLDAAAELFDGDDSDPLKFIEKSMHYQGEQHPPLSCTSMQYFLVPTLCAVDSRFAAN